MPCGTIVNFDISPFYEIGTLFVRKEGTDTYDIIPCEVEPTLSVLKRIYGSSEVNFFMGKTITYKVDNDGILSRIGNI